MAEEFFFSSSSSFVLSATGEKILHQLIWRASIRNQLLDFDFPKRWFLSSLVVIVVVVYREWQRKS